MANVDRELPRDGDRKRDNKAWFVEWRYWLIGVVVLTAVWIFGCIREGGLIFYWPMYALGIWAIVLVVAALLPTRQRQDSAGE